jgi:hypothetical protein
MIAPPPHLAISAKRHRFHTPEHSEFLESMPALYTIQCHLKRPNTWMALNPLAVQQACCSPVHSTGAEEYSECLVFQDNPPFEYEEMLNPPVHELGELVEASQQDTEEYIQSLDSTGNSLEYGMEAWLPGDSTETRDPLVD